jgi:hypothetical protein
MNCSLYYHLQQQAYIAGLKSEWAERDRKQREMIRHANDCPLCNGEQADPLVENLFGGLVIITNESEQIK